MRRVRPLIVIDLEDPEQVERVTRAFANEYGVDLHVDETLAALRSLIEPPKPQVYSHIVVSRGGPKRESLCGKVWTPGEDAEVVGKCPNCADIAEEWVS